jgi:hypothetical protein
MNAVECALRKQHLQFTIAAQRQALAGHIDGLAPLFTAADHVVAGADWLKHHPEAVVAGVTLFVAVRPRRWRALWRWSRRGFIVWRLWQDSARWLPSLAHSR